MKDRCVASMFCLIIGVIFIINLITPDEALSYSERRKLIQAPKIDEKFIFSGKAQTEMESYLLDQFAFRDAFRAAKAITDLAVFQKKDNNGIYISNGQVFKMNYPLKESSVTGLGEKMNEIYDMYLGESKVAYAIIPDKNTYAPEEVKSLRYDYYDLAGLLYSKLAAGGDKERFEFIDLRDDLALSDFYRTDLHWKQEGLGGVLEKLQDCFQVELPAAGLKNPDREGGGAIRDWEAAGYQFHEYSPFYGAYYGQAALPLKPDRLAWFTGSRIDGLTVKNMDTQAGEEDQVVYNPQKLGSIDSYEVFLSGNSPMIVMENPARKNGRELIVFRDSFGSSIAPFLAEGYAKVTLIDLRFLGYSQLGKFVDFNGQDVLFLFSADVANSSDMIRKY